MIYPTRIDEQIRYHINGTYLKEFLKRRHGWSKSIWNTIDFTAFGRHFKSLTGTAQRVQHMKFVHDLQPLGTHKARVQRSSDDSVSLCPCCNNHLETQVHLLLCSKNPARAKAVTTLQTACRKSDGTRISQVLGDILIQWLECPTQTPDLSHRINPFLRHELFPQEYLDIIHDAIAEQIKIGWINMFRGFLSVKWHRLASSHLGSDDGSTIIHRNDGANRVHRILKHIHTYTNDLWKGRNDVLHAADNAQAQKHLSALDTEITKLHTEADLVLSDNRFYCEMSLNRLLQGSTANKRRWLLRVKASRQRKLALQTQQPRITKYFNKNPTKSARNESIQTTATSKRNKSTQQLLTQFFKERDPNNSRPTSARNQSTQQLLTQFLRERASDRLMPQANPSPSPSTTEIG